MRSLALGLALAMAGFLALGMAARPLNPPMDNLAADVGEMRIMMHGMQADIVEIREMIRGLVGEP